MKVKPMLARFQSTIGRTNLIEQMVLLPEPKVKVDKHIESAESLNFIVGYNSSCNSHTALDIALCIAHQTRLATKMEVTVQVVFVVEDNQNNYYPDIYSAEIHNLSKEYIFSDFSNSLAPVLTKEKSDIKSQAVLEKADFVICQARSLALEWQGNFKAHLRFGCIAEELRKIVVSEAADVLFLGCKSALHPIITSLGSNFNSAVVGIPHCVEE
jgi:hypothetical protein